MAQRQSKSPVARIHPDEVYRLLDAGLSQGAVARQLGCNQSHISRLAKRRRALAQANGHQPTALQRVTLDGEPVSDPPAHQHASERISASERIDSAALQDHESRIAVLEAFMAAQQRQAQRTSAPDAPERISASAHSDALQRTEPVEWVNRGTHLAADMIARVKGYATEHRLEMREVIDLALRHFFAGEDERHG